MATLSTKDDKTTITFSYTALTTKVQPILEACAEYLWKEETDEEGNITNPFDEATNQEKLNVVDAHVKRVIIDLANSHLSNEAQKEAREAVSKLEL